MVTIALCHAAVLEKFQLKVSLLNSTPILDVLITIGLIYIAITTMLTLSITVRCCY